MSLSQAIARRWQRLKFAWRRRFGPDSYLCGCGHTATYKTVLSIHGREGEYVLPSANPLWCPQCFAKAAIKCAWCGYPIVPGDPVTLYTPGPRSDIFISTKEPSEAQIRRQQKEFVLPDGAVVYSQNPLRVVGCLRWECADTGGDRAGFWVMPGKVRRVMTIEEMLLATGNEEMLWIGDLSDPTQAIPIPEEAPAPIQ